MKFTYEDLAKAMELKVGDRIKCHEEKYIIDGNYWLRGEITKRNISIIFLINEEFEILPPKKKVGELKCNDLACDKCPFRPLLCPIEGLTGENLYDTLENFNEEYHDQEIYDIFKKRLDKEVEEDD